MVDSTVYINAKGQIGAGAVIGDDLVITAKHLVPDMSPKMELTTTDGVDHYVWDICLSEDTDLTLITATVGKRAYALGPEPQVGDKVTVIGSPIGYPWWAQAGIVAALEDHPGLGRIIGLDVDIMPGNSGGPVLDAQGRLVGIVSFLRRDGLYKLPFAISVVEIEKMLKERYDTRATEDPSR